MEPLLWGLGAVLVFGALAYGLRLVRADPLGHLSVEDRALIKEPARRRRGKSPFTWFGQRVGPEISGVMGASYRNFVSTRLVYAQSQEFASPADFFAMKARLLLIFGLGAVALFMFTQNVLFPLLVVILGFFLPDLILYSAGRRRQEEIEDALPDFLDVLAVTVSAGLSFRGALQRVLERTEGPLAVEMQTALRQMDVGTSRYEAFRDMKERTKSQSMEAFVTALMQSEDLGSPLVESLDQIATDLRQKRAQRARQEASKASPKIASVVTLIMVPGTMVLLLVSIWYVADIDFGTLFGE
ncbi:type II secretion system F family protein [Nesterenkonia muleiensis]|uniref:type II secretion system F family protein n=1 Tax=Nesterenkonia muleiensis TaxID=2282648 RepID=UPI000E76FC0D|nr:type II secretion system F family protein [Nesterenkonia muleiensis]